MKTGESGVSQEREWRGANEHELREKIEEGGWRKDATEEGEGVVPCYHGTLQIL